MNSPTAPISAPSLYVQWMQAEHSPPPSTQKDAEVFTSHPNQDYIIKSTGGTIKLEKRASNCVRNLILFGKLKLYGPPLSGHRTKLPKFSCVRIWVIGGRLKVRNVEVTVKEAIIPMTKKQFAENLLNLPDDTAEPLENHAPSIHLPSSFDITDDIDAFGVSDITGLMRAARYPHPTLLQLFLTLGADIHKRSFNNQSALHIAAQAGNSANVKLLLDAKADVNATDYCNITPLFSATVSAHSASMGVLLAAKADITIKNSFGQTPLTAAVDSGDREAINLLVANNAPLYKTNPLGPSIMTPALMHAVVNGGTTFLTELLQAKCDPDARNGSNDTALMLAAKYNQTGVVDLLLASRANIEAYNTKGTALNCAVEEGHTELVIKLLAAGASTKHDSWTNLFLAAAKQGHQQILKILIEQNPKGAEKLLIRAAKLGELSILSALLPEGLAPYENLNLALSHAAVNHNVEATKLLISKGASGSASLLRLLQKGFIQAAKTLVGLGAALPTDCSDKLCLLNFFILSDNLTDAQALINEGINPDQKNESGQTPLMFAVSSGKKAHAKMLLDAHANPNAVDYNGNTPLLHAILHGKQDLVRFLLDQNTELPVTTPGNLFSPLMQARIALEEVTNSPIINPTEAQNYAQIVEELILEERKSKVASSPLLPPRTTIKKTKTVQWKADLPDKNSIDFEHLNSAKTIEDVQEALTKITETLIQRKKRFSPAELDEFEQILSTPFLQSHRNNPILITALLDNNRINVAYST